MDFGILPMVPTWVPVHPRGMGPILGRLFFFPKLSDVKNLSIFQKIKHLVNLHLKNQKIPENSPSLGLKNSNFFWEKISGPIIIFFVNDQISQKTKKTWLIYTGKTRFFQKFPIFWFFKQ